MFIYLTYSGANTLACSRIRPWSRLFTRHTLCDTIHYAHATLSKHYNTANSTPTPRHLAKKKDDYRPHDAMIRSRTSIVRYSVLTPPYLEQEAPTNKSLSRLGLSSILLSSVLTLVIASVAFLIGRRRQPVL